MASDEGTASSKPLLTRAKRRRYGEQEKKPAKVPSIEVAVVERGPEREQEGNKIHQ